MNDPANIAPADPASTPAQALIAAAEAELAGDYPHEDQFGYSPEALKSEGVWFLLAEQAGHAIGCCGLATSDGAEGGHGEIKRLYVAPEARGAGLARRLMEIVEAEARRRGLSRVRLETGIHQSAALALYRRRGYREIPLFGPYVDSSTSICMEKIL